MRFINIYSCKLLFEIGSQDVVSQFSLYVCPSTASDNSPPPPLCSSPSRLSFSSPSSLSSFPLLSSVYHSLRSFQPQVLTNVQPSPVGKHLVGVSEAGNIVIYDAAALGQELYQVNIQSLLHSEYSHNMQMGFE